MVWVCVWGGCKWCGSVSRRVSGCVGVWVGVLVGRCGDEVLGYGDRMLLDIHSLVMVDRRIVCVASISVDL